MIQLDKFCINHINKYKIYKQNEKNILFEKSFSSNEKSHYWSLKNDIIKINLLIKQDLSVIHILQEDVWFDKNNWGIKLKNSIKEYLYSTIIIIDNNKNLYTNHLNELKKYNYEIILN
jgi:hypothetical protein